jgi:UMF1 family MFS transporter
VALLYVAKALGTKLAIVLSLLIWSGALVYAYGFLRTREDFLLLAGALGLVIGGSQALSRSVFSLMVPKGQESEYFSLYAVFGGGTTWIGPLFFGLALQITGSYRIALLSLVVFFVLGVLFLAKVDVRRAAREAGNEAPSRA